MRPNATIFRAISTMLLKRSWWQSEAWGIEVRELCQTEKDLQQDLHWLLDRWRNTAVMPGKQIIIFCFLIWYTIVILIFIPVVSSSSSTSCPYFCPTLCSWSPLLTSCVSHHCPHLSLHYCVFITIVHTSLSSPSWVPDHHHSHLVLTIVYFPPLSTPPCSYHLMLPTISCFPPCIIRTPSFALSFTTHFHPSSSPSRQHH